MVSCHYLCVCVCVFFFTASEAFAELSWLPPGSSQFVFFCLIPLWVRQVRHTQWPIRRLLRYWMHKCRCKVFPVCNYAPRHDRVGGSVRAAPCIRNLGCRWRWVVGLLCHSSVPQGRTIDIGWIRSCECSSAGHDAVEKRKSLPLPAIEPNFSSQHFA
jgi:hypothetical protein